MTGMEPLVAMQIAGTVVSAVGALQQASAAKNAAAFNAQVAQNNAVASRQKAEVDAERQDREARLRAGMNRAAVGGMGVTVEGSPLDVLESNAMQEELDRLSIIHSGEVKATGFENEAMLETARGKNAMRQGMMSAAGTIMMGGAQAYGMMGSGSTSGLGSQAALASGGGRAGYAGLPGLAKQTAVPPLAM